MKKYSFLAAALLLFAASCTVKVNTDDKDKPEDNVEVTTTATATKAVAKDPTCGMDKDATWTEYTVKGTDTTWFCSPHCKEAYAKKQAAAPADKKG